MGTVIIKHANPCGVSALKNKIESFKSALSSDPISAFGGIVSCNFKISKNLANELKNIFFEVIIANSFEKSALKVLKQKKNLRIIDASKVKLDQELKFNSLNDNILIQSEDKKRFSSKDFKISFKEKTHKNSIRKFNFCI